MALTALTLLLSAAASLIFLLGLSNVFLSPLRKVPGPFWTRFTGFWRLRRVVAGEWNTDLIALHQKYGRLVRLSPNEVSIDVPEAIHQIYGHTGSPWMKVAFFETSVSLLKLGPHKSEWYRTWWSELAHGVFPETDIPAHRHLRRRVAKAYTLSYILAMEKYVDTVLEVFLMQMNSNVNKVIDFSMWAQFFTYDVVADLAFGQNWGLLETGEDQDDIMEQVFMGLSSRAVLGWTPMYGDAVGIPWVRWILNNGYLRKIGKKISYDPRPVFRQTVRGKIAKRTTTGRNDLYNHFSNMKNPDGGPLTPQDILAESLNVVAAGADTTSISIQAFVRLVASSPRVYSKLQEEIDNAHSCGRLSQIATYEQGQQLQYFQAVLKECLRLWPAVGFNLPRVTPPEGATIAGVYIPPKTVVSINAWVINRNKSVYGEDADHFRPERWLEQEDPEQLKRMDQSMGTFGYGSRVCIGKNIALMEMNKLLPTLLRDYDIEVCNWNDPWKTTCAWFVFIADFKVRLRHREPKGRN